MESMNAPLTINVPARTIDRIAMQVQKFHIAESDVAYPIRDIVRAIRSYLVLQQDTFVSQLGELLTTPGNVDAVAFAEILERSFSAERHFVPEPEPEVERINVFTGFRAFSQERLEAMTLYIAEKGRDIYKTKLNKLLFYSDFINYYLHGRSISGSTYIHVPFGPVPEHYGAALERLAEAGRVELLPSGRQAVIVAPRAAAESKTELGSAEIRSINWVLDTYGKLSSSEISDLSHSEKAYRFTRPGEQIAYEYASFFETLPPKA